MKKIVLSNAELQYKKVLKSDANSEIPVVFIRDEHENLIKKVHFSTVWSGVFYEQSKT